jgi:hypothetical protein
MDITILTIKNIVKYIQEKKNDFYHYLQKENDEYLQEILEEVEEEEFHIKISNKIEESQLILRREQRQLTRIIKFLKQDLEEAVKEIHEREGIYGENSQGLPHDSSSEDSEQEELSKWNPTEQWDDAKELIKQRTKELLTNNKKMTTIISEMEKITQENNNLYKEIERLKEQYSSSVQYYTMINEDLITTLQEGIIEIQRHLGKVEDQSKYRELPQYLSELKDHFGGKYYFTMNKELKEYLDNNPISDDWTDDESFEDVKIIKGLVKLPFPFSQEENSKQD